MIDRDITGMSWLRLKAGRYTRREEKFKMSRCQLELDISYRDVVPLPSEGEWLKIAPLRILSFDIECSSKRGFPQAKRNPVIQIGNYCKIHRESTHEFKKIFTLKSCTNIVGSDIHSFETEKEMLLSW